MLTAPCTTSHTQIPVLNLESFARWLAGVQEKKRTIEALRLSEGREDTAIPLEELDWTESVLRSELQRVLIQSKLNALDLIRKFDKDGSGLLEKKVRGKPGAPSSNWQTHMP